MKKTKAAETSTTSKFYVYPPSTTEPRMETINPWWTNCTNCGYPSQVGWKFCPNCGIRVNYGSIAPEISIIEFPPRETSTITLKGDKVYK